MILPSQTVVKVVEVGRGTDVPTLVIALVGLVVAVGTAAWQVASRWLDAPRLKLTLKRGYKGSAGIVSAPPQSPQMNVLAAQGYTEPLLGVEVTNVGRFPIDIQNASARADESGMEFHRLGWNINPQRDYRLEPYSSATWWVDMQSIQVMVSTSAATKAEWNRPQKVRMVVSSAVFGKSKRTKEAITVTP